METHYNLSNIKGSLSRSIDDVIQGLLLHAPYKLDNFGYSVLNMYMLFLSY